MSNKSFVEAELLVARFGWQTTRAIWASRQKGSQNPVLAAILLPFRVVPRMTRSPLFVNRNRVLRDLDAFFDLKFSKREAIEVYLLGGDRAF